MFFEYLLKLITRRSLVRVQLPLQRSSLRNQGVFIFYKEKSIEKMSLARLTSAALGSFAANGTTYLVKKLISPNLLPATKDDIEKLNARLERFQEIKSAKNDVFGRKPYYDNVEMIIVYK